MNVLERETPCFIQFGPFLDDTDGKSIKAGLTLSAGDIRISKNGAAFVSINDTSAITHNENGYYRVPLNSTDLSSVGRLRMHCHKTGCLPVWEEWAILGINSYNNLFAMGGASTVIITVIDNALNRIPDAKVQIWNTTLDTLIGFATTDSSGQVSLTADDGGYKVKIRKAGYSFSDPFTLTLSGSTAITYTGTTYIISAPASVSVCRVYEYCMDVDGNPKSSVSGIAKVVSVPEDLGGVLFPNSDNYGIYDVTTGIIYWDVPRTSVVQFKISEFSINLLKIIPDSATVRLMSIA